MDGEKFDDNHWKKGVHELFEKLIEFIELSTDCKKKYKFYINRAAEKGLEKNGD